MKHIVAIIIACIFPALLVGCGGNLKCGAGTVEQDGVCVPSGPREEVVTDCGAGTERVGATCVLIGSVDEGDTNNNAECTPDCEGKECGLDGCGGFCSPCTDDAKPFCDLETSTCIALDCDPFCPIGSQCGDDGCGGTCGECPGDLPFCSPDNICAEVCTPDCDDKVCGDDGCGGTCGECSGGESCNAGGSCVPSTWICAPGSFGDGQICDCECGAPDPDCDDPATEGTLAANCLNYQICDAQGSCQDTVPAEWTCDPARYGEGGTCDCGCGVIDSDCADSNLPVAGCMGSDICNSDGSCGACVPSCDGKMCGNDGCGGNCGTCDDPNAPICNGNQCVSACDPVPLRCETNTCGDDGCGGTCGTCGAGEECVAGNCEVATDPASCAGNCGGIAESGCSCTPDCEAAGNCCLDYLDICPVVCTPDCNNRQCGDDGCGGSCGMCNDMNFPMCNAVTGQCEAACVPDCANKTCGDDGCGGSCGMCNDPNFPMCDMNQGRCIDPNCTPDCTFAECGGDGCGGSCGVCGPGDKCFEAEGLCAPETWVCDAALYDDGFCQCGCGGPEADCSMSMPPFDGCPDTVSCSMTTGHCDMPRCRADAQCVVGELCVGAYPEGGGACQANARSNSRRCLGPPVHHAWSGTIATRGFVATRFVARIV